MTAQSSFRERWIHLAFLVGIAMKAMDGVLELIGGILLLVVSRSTLIHTAVFWTSHELAEDPTDPVANFLVHLANTTSVNTKTFVAAYLLGHGGIKVFLVTGLLLRKLWVYPVAVFVLVGFIGYEIFRVSRHFSIAVAFFAVVDAAVVVFVWLEFRRLLRARRSDEEKERST